MNLWRLIMYPITSPFHNGNATRALAIGGPFVAARRARSRLSAAAALRQRPAGRRGRVFRHVVRPARVDSLPLHATTPPLPLSRSSRSPLAGLTLQALWERRPGWRPALVGGGCSSGRRARRRLLPVLPGRLARGEAVLRRELVEHLAEARARRTSPSTGTSSAGPGSARRASTSRLGPTDGCFAKAVDYKFEGWPLHGLRLVNGLYKGVDMHEIAPARVYLRGEIRGDPRVSGSALTLDALNVGYVLATAADDLAPTLSPEGDVPPRAIRERPSACIEIKAPGPTRSCSRPAAKRIGTLAAPQRLLDPGPAVRRLRLRGPPA